VKNRYSFFLRLVLGSILCIALSSCESNNVKDAAMDEAADVASDAMDDAAVVADDAVDSEDRCDRSVNFPEGHPCHIPPR
jgi:hypothetical protein